jgi:hypothetical protein
MTDGVSALALFDIEGVFERYKEKKLDRRRSKGSNHYTDFVSKAFEIIQKFLAEGYSVNEIFRILVEEGVFGENADKSNFHKAWRRERIRREGEDVSGKISAAASGGSKAKDEKAEQEKAERERGENERVVTRDRQDVRIPVDVPDDLKEGRRKERYSFSDYPKHIQEAIGESERNGTLLKDRDKNSRMIQEWIDQQGQGSEKENGTAE